MAGMNESVSTIRRVRRPKDQEAIMVRLAQGSDSVFATFVDLLCFAACLGYSRGLSLPFDNSLEPVPWHIFENSGKDSVVNLIAAVSSEDFGIVGADRFDEKLRVFEQYANGGLQVLSELVEKSPKSPFDVITDLILEAQKTTSGVGSPLEQMARDLSW
jgi:dnd system-associated protein 4